LAVGQGSPLACKDSHTTFLDLAVRQHSSSIAIFEVIMSTPSMIWANEDSTAVRVLSPLVEIEHIVPWPTEDEPSWLQSIIAEALEGGEVIAPYEAPADPALTKVSKADVWRRLTDQEAEEVDSALQAAPLRLRRIFEAAQYLDVNDDDYPEIRTAIVTALSEKRADEVLQPTY
jgi:hypothetical protein